MVWSVSINQPAYFETNFVLSGFIALDSNTLFLVALKVSLEFKDHMEYSCVAFLSVHREYSIVLFLRLCKNGGGSKNVQSFATVWV